MTDPATPPDSLKIISVNANSLRRAWSKGLQAYIDSTSPDIFCIQETDVSSDLPNTFHLSGYRGYFSYPTIEDKPLGSAVYTKIRPLSARIGFDESEGRILILEFTRFYLLTVLAPSAGDGLAFLRTKIDEWNPKFAALAEELQVVKPVVIAGDFNVAHKELDIYDAADQESTAGFTPDERGWFDNFLSSGFVDVFREKNPDVQEFTYFGRRFGRKGRGRGRRLDYFVVAKGTEEFVVECSVDSSPNFSDHVPIVLTLDRAHFLTEDDVEVERDERDITVVNSGAIIPPIDPVKEVKKPKKKRIDPEDLQVILLETRTSERIKKPIQRDEFEQGEEKPKKPKIKFDDLEYGRPLAKRKTGKKLKK
jgi:exodeoxyribonuclease III